MNRAGTCFLDWCWSRFRLVSICLNYCVIRVESYNLRQTLAFRLIISVYISDRCIICASLSDISDQGSFSNCGISCRRLFSCASRSAACSKSSFRAGPLTASRQSAAR